MRELLTVFWLLLFLVIAFFYLFRLVSARTRIHPFDGENEVGHAMMAIGMMFMLAPAGLLTSDLLRWNIILFALASLWWTARLFVRKPLLALLQGQNGVSSTFQADAIHVFMYGGMCYLFFLMSNMAFSMTQSAASLNCIFLVSFALLTLFYGREISKDVQTPKRNWLQCGANIAHSLMSGVMCWMFFEMISMTIAMGRP